jgi:hypothetical protein
LQFEGVASGRNQGQRYGAIGDAVEILGFKPCAEARIIDFRFTLPEIGLETALNAEMAELKFDVVSVSWEIATHICGPNMEARDAVAFALSFDDHKAPVLRYSVSVHG